MTTASRSVRLLMCLSILPLLAADWARFRGPGGSAVSDERGLPGEWSSSDSIVWRTDLPGPGASSPITFGDRIFLTCYSGYGLSEADPVDQKQLLRHVLGLDRRTGNILWNKQVAPKLPEQAYQGFQALHGYASSTPATDGERVYVFFGKTGVFAFDFSGEEVWQADVGSRTHNWGTATSPVLYKDFVIVNASVESGSLVALDKRTGSEVWRAPGMRSSWNTPTLVDVEGGRQELVVSVQGSILGFDPDNGKQLWQCEGIPDYVCPSVVAKDGVVYAIGGRQGAALAVRAGGRGNVTSSHVVWRQRGGSNVSSPVVFDKHVYWVSDQGMAFCLQADSGKIVYQERLPRAGRVYASVVAADGKLYAVSREAGTFVLALEPQFKQLAHNVMRDDRSIFNASPAVSNGQLLLRSDRALYCIGKE